MKQQRKKLPRFTDPVKEQLFWQQHDSTDYLDWSKAQLAVFPNLKPSTKTISLRLPENLLNTLKILANQRDVPYQSFIKMLLAEAVHRREK